MLDEALVALAAASGTAVVAAANTDAWTGFRRALARWLGRGNSQREQAELERLGRTAAALQAAEPAQAELTRQEVSWQTRIEYMLESLDATELDQAADELRAVLARHALLGGVSAGRDGVTVAGNVDIRADAGSIAAGLIYGVHIGSTASSGTSSPPRTVPPASAGTPGGTPIRVRGSSGSVAIGHVNHQVTYYAGPPPAVTWPLQIGVLPRQADCFQDRASAERLEQVMAEEGTEATSQVLVGLGGSGKTQLAAHYARAQWHAGQLDLLVWIGASTRAEVVASYAQAAAEVLGAALEDPEEAARAFLTWLAFRPNTAQRRWLIVLDDVADPNDLLGLWPPANPIGRTLVTTRRRDAALLGGGRHMMSLGQFTDGEAVDYLTSALAAHGRHESPEDLGGLAGDLGHLPLALSQAAAYLIDTDLSCAAYRRLLGDHTGNLNDVLPEQSGLPDDHTSTVAAAWSLSIDRADQLRPAGLARPMLQLAAMLDPNGVPEPVLTSQPALDYLTQHRGSGPGLMYEDEVTSQDATSALRALHRFSLVDHDRQDDRAVRVHVAVQRAVRSALTHQDREWLARVAADALMATWPEVERDSHLVQVLRASAEELARNAEGALYLADGAHPLLFRVGLSLGEAGQVSAAIRHFQHLASTSRHRLGSDHPSSLQARGNVARWRGEAGDAAGAARAFAELLDDELRVLGPDHPATFTTRADLARWRGEAGDAAGAAR
ncbi:NB-ARC domain-containing protein, partial [Streptomyces sp. NPDC006208]|uniref:NB-ARC domain-containing protein n=1 Tax=Streptomyces sp. NPDC006208 TaxID=3156734 RepID=UPI0033A65049